MAKTFTKRPLKDFNQVKVESLVDNRDGAIDQFNGNLDSTQLFQTVKGDYEAPQTALTFSGLVDKQTSILPTQTLAFSRRDYRNTGGTVTDIWTRINHLNLQTDIWNKGFNEMTVFGSDWSDFPLSIECEEGILTGEVTVDWEHGNQGFEVTVEDDPPLSGTRARGMGWYTEWGVFVNNVMVARSGFIYPRRHTTRIPYSVPVGTQLVTIDCRFVVVSYEPLPAVVGKWSADFNMFSATIVARNIKR